MEISTLSMSVDDWKRKYNNEILDTNKAMEELRRNHGNELDDLRHQHRRELSRAKEEADDESRRKERIQNEEVTDLKRKMEDLLEEERQKRRRELQELSAEGTVAQQKFGADLEAKDQTIKRLEAELDQANASIAREKESIQDLRGKLSDAELV